MNLDNLKHLGKQYDIGRKHRDVDSVELTLRLKHLVNKFGVSAVAAVLDKQESTILVYTRYKNAETGCVKQYDVLKAEHILNNQ